MLLAPGLSLAADPAGEASRALVWLAVGSVVPFLAVAATAFAKAAVLLGILRGGLGAQGALPATVTTALAAALTLLVMAPIGQRAAEAAGPVPVDDPSAWPAAVERAWPVVEGFLAAHTQPADAAAIQAATAPLGPAPGARPFEQITAFLISELSAAFQIGVLLLLPFLVVDLLVANTLVTVGFNLLPPALIALPFKLLLFVAADGWALFARGFLAAYQ